MVKGKGKEIRKGWNSNDLMARRQNVRRDIMSGAMSSETDLAVRYGVSPSTIKHDKCVISELIRMEMEETLPDELAMAISRFEANALRALNAFEESRRKRVDCKVCGATGWVKAIVKRSPPRKLKKVRCPKKFKAMAWEDGRVKEYRLVVAREIDRCLAEEEVVHHIDMDERNNKPGNLMLFKNDFDHNQFHSGLRVEVIWSGTPGVRPIEAKEWCSNCDGEGFIWYNTPGSVMFLAEYRMSIKERATLLGLYPKTESQRHLHLHGAQQGKFDVSQIPSEMILEARMFQDELERRMIEGKSVEVEDLDDAEPEGTKP